MFIGENKDNRILVFPKDGTVAEGFWVPVAWTDTQALPGGRVVTIYCPESGVGCRHREQLFREADKCKVRVPGFNGPVICGKFRR